MRHDPALVQDTRAWLTRASRDIRAAEHDMKAAPPLLDAVVFHCQQAAEKALKAFLAWHDLPFRRTHSLEEIGHQCVELDGGLAAIVDRSAPLTEYAWKYRYPSDQEEPPLSEAEDALRMAKLVLQAILERLPNEVRP